jgi:hypothetical protein
MNSRVEKDFYFLSAVHIMDTYWVNAYEVTVSMIVETENEVEANVAIERISHYIDSAIQNSIFIDRAASEKIEKYKEAGMKVCCTPGLPHDQVVASILMLKLNAIMENRITITDIVLTSKLNGDLRYNVVLEVAEEYYSGNNWWNKSDISINCTTDDTNIVKLFDDNEWKSLNLGWK